MPCYDQPRASPDSMILLLAQSLLLFAFGIGLYLLWRAAEPSERWLKWIVATGFLARAVAGQALFWISWTRLPLLRSLQTPDGSWLFAQDSTFYFPQAIAAAEKGWHAIVFYDRASASVTYVQLLACMISLLGGLISVGILLNLFCYLGTIVLLVRWSRAPPPTWTTVAVAIAAISLTPSLVLWSLQPLKDSLFQLLFVAFVAACATWQRSWLTEGLWRARAVTGALLAVILFLVAGIRWYFAGALVAATSVFLLIVAFTAAERKTFSFAAAAMMIVVLTRSLVLSAGPYIPPGPHSMFAAIEQVRRGFDTIPASTVIKSGKRLAIAGAATPLATTLLTAAPPPQLTEAHATRIRALLDEQAAAWNRSDVARAMDGYWRSPQLEIVDGTTVIHGWEQAAEDHRRGRSAVGSLRMTALRLTGAGDTASVSGRWELTTLVGYPYTRMFMMTLRRFPNGQWKIVREVWPAPASAAPSERLLVGAAAMAVPRALGERLGLFDIGGGRGLLWFTEIDTMIFDLALFFALWAVFAARGALTWRNPLPWLVLLTMLIVGAPLVYSISNFGTLFRLREMIYLGLLLIPMCAAAENRGQIASP